MKAFRVVEAVQLTFGTIEQWQVKDSTYFQDRSDALAYLASLRADNKDGYITEIEVKESTYNVPVKSVLRNSINTGEVKYIDKKTGLLVISKISAVSITPKCVMFYTDAGDWIKFDEIIHV